MDKRKRIPVRQWQATPYRAINPRIPIRSHKCVKGYPKPTAEMLKMAEIAVAQGTVQRVQTTHPRLSGDRVSMDSEVEVDKSGQSF